MKGLTFTLVIALSMFVLGGCDQLLEAFFPEDIIEEDFSYGAEIVYDWVLVDLNTTTTLNYYITTPGTYYINWEDSYDNSGLVTYTCDVELYASDSYSQPYYLTNNDSGYPYPQQIEVTTIGNLRIDLEPWGSGTPGTCRVWITQ